MVSHGRIDRMQNDDHSMILLRAIHIAHRRTQRAQAISLLISMVIACLGVLAKAAHPPLLPVTTIAGATWAATYALVLAPWISRTLRVSAVLQEMLDTYLFGTRWNTVLVGSPLPEDEVNRLSRRFHGDQSSLRDYYLVARVAAPYDVLFCLEQNLSWGSRVRRRYAGLLLAVIVSWCIAGLGVGVVIDATVAVIVTAWFVPSLGLLLSFSDAARAQLTNTAERTRAAQLVRTIEHEHPTLPLAEAQTVTDFIRQVQDVLFLARRQQPRTPQWFFRLSHADDMADFQYRKHALEDRAGSP